MIRLMFTSVMIDRSLSRGLRRRMWLECGHIRPFGSSSKVKSLRRSGSLPSSSSSWSGESTSGAPLRHRPNIFAAIRCCSSGSGLCEARYSLKAPTRLANLRSTT